MVLCIFEDAKTSQLLPLTHTRPAYELKVGLTTLQEKIARAFGTRNVTLQCRPYLEQVVKKGNPRQPVNRLPKTDACLFVNGRLLLDHSLVKKLRAIKTDKIFTSQKTVVAARLSGQSLKKLTLKKELDFSLLKVPRVKVRTRLIEYLWELIKYNPEMIRQEATASGKLGKIEGKIFAGVYLVNRRNIYVAAGATVKPGAVLDASAGPIFIEKGVIISANTTIEGPVYIGTKTKINAGAKILGGTTIGEVCKVGGEVSHSIIHSYTNKQHDGFLGHAYVGSWCNLGAGTSNSDLKNNYGTVSVTINGKKVDTGQQFIGLFMGDHSKSGINTMFNTGTVVGVGCNVFGSGYLPKSIPSFTWFDGQNKPVPYRIDKCLATAREVYQRRAKKFQKAETDLLKHLYEISEPERKAFIKQ